jgi:hypothetical protein
MTPHPYDPTKDPRPDLLRDHYLWARLLPCAWIADGSRPNAHGLLGILNGLRCHGCSLTRDGATVRLGRGELGEAEYAQLREQYLRPHAARITALLTEVGERLERLEANRADLPA